MLTKWLTDWECHLCGMPPGWGKVVHDPLWRRWRIAPLWACWLLRPGFLYERRLEVWLRGLFHSLLLMLAHFVEQNALDGLPEYISRQEAREAQALRCEKCTRWKPEELGRIIEEYFSERAAQRARASREEEDSASPAKQLAAE